MSILVSVNKVTGEEMYGDFCIMNEQNMKKSFADCGFDPEQTEDLMSLNDWLSQYINDEGIKSLEELFGSNYEIIIDEHLDLGIINEDDLIEIRDIAQIIFQ